VNHPVNLEEAEANFGIERVYRHRKNKESRRRKTVYMTPELCLDCGKQGYRSEEAARIIISRMLKNGTLSGPDAFTFKPYLCHHGWWHTGHDPKSRRVFHELAARQGNNASFTNAPA
jgi:hypothetical protein